MMMPRPATWIEKAFTGIIVEYIRDDNSRMVKNHRAIVWSRTEDVYYDFRVEAEVSGEHIYGLNLLLGAELSFDAVDPGGIAQSHIWYKGKRIGRYKNGCLLIASDFPAMLYLYSAAPQQVDVCTPIYRRNIEL